MWRQWVISGALVAMAMLASARTSVAAGANCELPSVFSLLVEQRELLEGRGGGLVIVRAPQGSSLRVGDVLRQANGRRVVGCGDLEAVAADALAKGLMLLVSVERDGGVFVAGLSPSPAEPAPDSVAADTGGSRGAASESSSDTERRPAVAAEPPAPTREETRAVTTRPTVGAVPTPIVAREAALPPRAAASTEVASKAVAAAAVLGTVDEAARLTVPLAAYERRLADAKNAVAALNLAGEGSAEVRAVIAEGFAYHETARDIRRFKAAELKDARVDERGAGGVSLPYFSDSDVPRWVERYPFLSESLQQAPRATHLLLPGEVAGRWSPDRAVELLWERAATTTARLGEWAAGR